MNTTDIQQLLITQFGDKVSDFHLERDIFTFEASPEVNKDVIRFLKEDSGLQFNFLTDLCGVHYPDHIPARQYMVTYLLHNWVDNIRIRMKSYLHSNEIQISSVSDVFSSANWMERETYDFYGILFIGHPNLKRILNLDSMTSFPMRKDFPLEDAGRTDKDDRFFGRTTYNY